jgi:hypothetical protein
MKKLRERNYGNALTKIDDLLARGQAAELLVDRLLDWAIANRASKGKSNFSIQESRFVNCYTYGPYTFPDVLIDALKFMGEPVKGLKVCKTEAGRGARKRASDDQ